MPGSAPAGSLGTNCTVGPVAPLAPDAPASPRSPLAEAGTAKRITTTVATTVAGAVDRRRDVVVGASPPGVRDRAGYWTVPRPSTRCLRFDPSTPPEVEPGTSRGVTPGHYAFELEGLPEAPPDLRLARPRRARPPHPRLECEDHHPRAGTGDPGDLAHVRASTRGRQPVEAPDVQEQVEGPVNLELVQLCHVALHKHGPRRPVGLPPGRFDRQRRTVHADRRPPVLGEPQHGRPSAASQIKRPSGLHPGSLLHDLGRRDAGVPRRSATPIRSLEGAARGRHQMSASNVSQAFGSPESKPVRNQVTRCSDVPCVNDSGSILPCVRSWIRSSPTAAAAVRASSMSPGWRTSRA